jgi:hypothetical protein
MSQAVGISGSGLDDPTFRAIPHLFELPEDWKMSSSWKRAQTERDEGGPINAAERMVSLSDSDDYHRVYWALVGASLRCKCSFQGFQYGDWCAHVASLWWRWSRGRLQTEHVKTGRQYQYPPSWMRVGEAADADLEQLPPKQLDAWLHCERGNYGVREFARATGRAAGTIGNHLRRARETLEGAEQ